MATLFEQEPDITYQRRSHLFLVGAAEIERRWRECERRRREAVLGRPGACPPPRQILKQSVRFRAFLDDFKQQFRFFLETFFWYFIL